jgi:hypothetical protein
MTSASSLPIPAIGTIAWGIDQASDSEWPLVGGERHGVRLASTPVVAGIDLTTSGAIVYTDEQTAVAAHAKHPADSMGGRGEVRRLEVRPSAHTRFVRADLSSNGQRR